MQSWGITTEPCIGSKKRTKNDLIRGFYCALDSILSARTHTLKSFCAVLACPSEICVSGMTTDVPVNQDIVLSGNSVRDVSGPAVFIGSASKVLVSGTQVEDSNRRAEHYFLGTASTEGSIVVSQSHDVTIAGTEMTGAKTGPVSIDRHSTSEIKVAKRAR